MGIIGFVLTNMFQSGWKVRIRCTFKAFMLLRIGLKGK